MSASVAPDGLFYVGPMVDPETLVAQEPPDDSAPIAPRAVLVIHTGDEDRVVSLVSDMNVVVGRTSDADVVIDHPTLSRRHARFRWNGSGGIWVEDLESTNGLHIAGERVDQAFLLAGDRCRLGDVEIGVQLGGAGSGMVIDGLERLEAFVADSLASTEAGPMALLQIGTTSLKAMTPLLELVRALRRSRDRMAPLDAETILWAAPHCDAADARARLEQIRRVSEIPLRLCAVVATRDGTQVAAELLRTAKRSFVSLAPGDAPVVRPLQAAPAVDANPVMTPTVCSQLAQVGKLARARIPVLVRGETGSGKELVARALHDQSPRAARPFVAVNCGAVPESLLASTLFGHVKGAFTGAERDSKGYFREADGGTVFLDEVGELSLSAQAALLRVLESGRVVPVGSSREVAVDVRLVSATHRDLEGMVEDGSFRRDLFFRVNGAVIRVVPLRDRPGEIVPLAQHFLDAAYRGGDTRARVIGEEAIAVLKRYPWPGNVRELKSVIERAAILTTTDALVPGDLPARLRTDVASASAFSTVETEHLPFKDRVQSFEVALIQAALEATGGNKTEAAKRLDIPIRTLSYKVKSFGIGEVPR